MKNTQLEPLPSSFPQTARIPVPEESNLPSTIGDGLTTNHAYTYVHTQKGLPASIMVPDEMHSLENRSVSTIQAMHPVSAIGHQENPVQVSYSY